MVTIKSSPIFNPCFHKVFKYWISAWKLFTTDFLNCVRNFNIKSINISWASSDCCLVFYLQFFVFSCDVTMILTGRLLLSKLWLKFTKNNTKFYKYLSTSWFLNFFRLKKAATLFISFSAFSLILTKVKIKYLKSHSQVWDNFWQLKALQKGWKMFFISPYLFRSQDI